MAFWRRSRQHPATDPAETGGAPLDNTALVEAMQAVAVNDSEQSRATLFRLLLDARLIVATPDAPPAPVRRLAGPSERMAVVMQQDEEGTLLPLFTSVDTLLAWQPQGTGFAVLAASALFQIAMADPTTRIVIDPGSFPQGILTSFEIATLASGRLPLSGSEVLAAGTQLSVGRPSTPPPDDVVQAVRDALAAEPGAQAAWLFLQQLEGHAPEMTIGVELRDGIAGEAEGAAMRGIVDGAFGRSAGVRSLTFMVVTPGQRPEIVAAGEEIFRR